MGRELIWLEQGNFAAWGCNACSWLRPNPGPLVAGMVPAHVRDAFDKHECAKFPRIVTGRGGNLRKQVRDQLKGN